ncbi:4-amino-4-deoxy-L-arabinose-phospho-UDP flippase, partial [Proteus mirabilis]
KTIGIIFIMLGVWLISQKTEQTTSH